MVEVTESIDERLALFTWLIRVEDIPVLDLRRDDRSWLESRECGCAIFEYGCPGSVDIADGLLRVLGRMTCEAPFRYDRCILSFDGDGGRSVGGFRDRFENDAGSGDAVTSGGVRSGG